MLAQLLARLLARLQERLMARLLAQLLPRLLPRLQERLMARLLGAPVQPMELLQEEVLLSCWTRRHPAMASSTAHCSQTSGPARRRARL